MNEIIFRTPAMEELHKVSAQIKDSYTKTYRGMMNQAYLDSLKENYWVPILRDSMENDDTILIVEIDNNIVGTVVYGKSQHDPQEADLHAIYLSPQHIGKGIGHKLYCKMEEMMMAQGFKSCLLEVMIQNSRAIKFYQDHGYLIASEFTVQENQMDLKCYTMKKLF